MRVKILGISVDCVDMDSAIQLTGDMISSERPNSILAVNPEKIITANKDREIFQALQNAALCIPDGIGVVVAAKLWGAKNIARVPGSELMPKLCELAARNGYSIYLFGGSETVNETAANVLLKTYPNLIISGRDNGYLAENQYDDLVNRINASKAQILFVALGSPKQERWIESHRDRLTNVRVCQGVGGTFDVISGQVERAPAAFRRLHLEWAYRLITQPSRAKRQIALPIFAYRAIKERLFFRAEN